ncbi:long-chain fatty acid--CoA ligase [Georgenia wutianyii]|uniref:Acyl-CoA synthetase n=1 Tax=Georgenia wutianyii TaxID=2585135 RepID=A0ABX5VQX8_9MICO|nr:AMP-dependent synthetase/ligase [Georgenia wutianyii]QDB79469.1 long-chain fatty acid--CoA ligase [Georgenia wutianyii]
MDEFHVPLAVTSAPSTSISDLLIAQVTSSPSKVLIEKQEHGSWRPYTTTQVLALVESVAKGLMAAGVEQGDRVAIMSRTRFEWTILDFAIWHAGAVPVPVYETSSADQSAWILGDSGCVAAFVETPAHAAIVAEARAENGGLPKLGDVWTIEEGALEAMVERGRGVSDADLAARHAAVGLEDTATLIYTSGTTGRPKGAELTHGNFVELCSNAIEDLSEVLSYPDARTLLFMPLAHVFARFVEVLVIAGGVTLGHTPDTKDLVADMGTFTPTFILSVPRVFEKVYNSAEQKAAAGGKVKIFHWATKVNIAYSRALDEPGGPGLRLKALHKVADALVLKKIRAVMGGRVVYAISGGAPLGERLGHFYRGLGLVVLEGYGLTETTAPVAVNRPAKVKIGTVGPPLPGTAIKIAEDGEILAKGIPVFRGYHNNPEATAEAFTDGWFHTGDVGSLDEDGYLTITGRKKEIIVTAAGKNVAPSQLEDPTRAHPLISQCLAIGDRRHFVSMLVTLDVEMLPSWLQTHGREPMTVAEAKEDPMVLEHIQMAIDRTNKKVSRAESIRKFVVLDQDFTIENGYLTPSMKVRRNAVMNDYADLIDEIYAQSAPAKTPAS